MMRIFAQARVSQRNAGFTQWEDEYPSMDICYSDIRDSIGYILNDDDKTAGYVAIASNDDEYDRHPELWDIEETYAVFHRIALSDDYRGKNVSSGLFDLAEAKAVAYGARYIRIDTGLENKPMQHILAKRGYTNLGIGDFAWGKRLAYEKALL